MGKKLSEMTLEELWQLFPIFLTEHDQRWADMYLQQEASLRDLLKSEDILCISHIGSTAINGICAKPIIDILLEVTTGCDINDIASLLTENGWICMSRSAERMSFNMGYTENGFAERVYHLHLRRAGDRDEVYFRDYMNAHPEAAKEYEALKLRLWKEYEHDRDGYTAAKADMVRRYTTMAKLGFMPMDSSRFDEYEEKLFSILSENMHDIDPGLSSDHDSWYGAVSEGLKRPARRIILIMCGNEVAGFFQYYINTDTFMMEEIQLRPEYRHKYGIFRSLFGYLEPLIAQETKHIKAFAHKDNTASDSILKRMGLVPVTADGEYTAYSGSMDDFRRWLRKTDEH